MAAPVFIGAAQTLWATTATPKTTSPVVAALVGDIVVAVTASEDANGASRLSITGTGYTPSTQRESFVASTCEAEISAAAVSADGNVSATIANTAANRFGGNLGVFRGSSGIGAVPAAVTGSSTGQIGITTTQDDSSVVVLIADFAAVDGAGRVYLNVGGAPVEADYTAALGNYTIYVLRYPNVGVAGAKTVGIASGVAGMSCTVLAIEVKGTAAPSEKPVPPRHKLQKRRPRSRVSTLRETSLSWFDASALFPADAGGAINLTAAGVSVPATISTAALTQAHALTVANIVVPATISSPAVTQAHALTAGGIAVSVAISTQAATQAQALTAQNISVQVTLETGSVTQAHNLSAANISVPIAISAPTLAGSLDLVAANISVPVTLSGQALTQAYALTPANVAAPVVIGAPTLTQGHALAAEGVAVPVVIDAPSIAQTHQLVADSVVVPVTISEPTIGGAINLVASSISVPITIESPSLYVVPDEVFGGRRAKKPAPRQQIAINLRPSSLRCAVSVSTMALRQQHRLSAVGVKVPVAIDSPLIEQWQAARLTKGSGLFGHQLTREAR